MPWDHRLRSGRTLWDELALHYQRGVDWVAGHAQAMGGAEGGIDSNDMKRSRKKLAIQERDAVWWRDACLLYFQTFSKRPLPAGVEKAGEEFG